VHYAIGDIQGCFAELSALLADIRFQPSRDTLWLVGDLVHRGPQSLAVLRFAKALSEHRPSALKVVLGNHDLTLLAVAAGHREAYASDLSEALLAAPDRDSLLHWLADQPLAYRETVVRDNGVATDWLMVHAGILPSWSFDDAMRHAREVESTLREDASFLPVMFGNQPDRFDEALKGHDRIRALVNVFTRMRFVDAHGTLDLRTKTDVPKTGFTSWFSARQPENTHGKGVSKALPESSAEKAPAQRIVFGHWASLGLTVLPHVVGLDSGAVWGRRLTAMRLNDGGLFSVPSGFTSDA
jgi:bis(5'-nucleosyl)-tetraphosphatase (symmetrical)